MPCKKRLCENHIYHEITDKGAIVWESCRYAIGDTREDGVIVDKNNQWTTPCLIQINNAKWRCMAKLGWFIVTILVIVLVLLAVLPNFIEMGGSSSDKDNKVDTSLFFTQMDHIIVSPGKLGDF